MPNRSDGTASLEMPELDDDDVPLLDKGEDPFNCERLIKILARG